MDLPLRAVPPGYYPAPHVYKADPTVNPIRENLFFLLCRPFLRLMRLGGMFFMPLSFVRGEHSALINQYMGNRYARGCFELLSHCYCVLVFAIMALFCGKSLFTIHYAIQHNHINISNENLGGLVQAVVYGVWIIQILLTHVVFIYACWKDEGIAHLMAFWEHTHFRCLDPNCRYLYRKRGLYRSRNKFMFFGVLNIAVQICTLLLPMLVPAPIYRTLRGMLFGGYMEDNPLIITLGVLGAVYTAFVYILPIFFFAMVCHFIIYDYNHICYEIKKLQTTREIYPWMEWIRLRHNAVCLFVETADGVFAPYILLTLVCNVFQILMGIFVVYQDSMKEEGIDLMKGLSSLYWMLQYLLQLIIILGAGTALSNAARSPMAHVYKISQEPAAIPSSPELFLLRLQTFLNKLTYVWNVCNLRNPHISSAN
ncbi:uncharacterized protein LOC129583075 isoform X2 [Paramacrobiotus metropolitanus]|uniref:uncharacterized protein LOC129583075 isoform X2 n=1 Tax=Paramacrobiotus metropolitanus TaxID=2943436 RepID=UPI002445AB1D|nr:uncharacterized protein LOC129583075 isoform X2 [Paramacrobiotus metropolitanus]